MRDYAVAVAAGLVLIGTVAAGWTFLSGLEPDTPPGPAEVAAAWAQAWAEGDVDGMAALQDREGDVRDTLATIAALAVVETSVTVTDTTLGEADGTAQSTFDVTVTLDGVGDWSWTTSTDLERNRGRWRLRWQPGLLHPAIRDQVTLQRRDVVVPRAPILDRDGRALTSQGDLVVVGIEPRRINNLDRLRDRLLDLLPEAVAELDETMARDDLVPTWFYPLVTVPDIRIAPVQDQVDALPGIILRTEQGRVAADDVFAVHTLGRIGPASKEQAEARGLEPGTEVGRSGLEAAYDAQLRGGAAVEIVAIEPDGDERAVLAVLGEGSGEPVATSLEVDVQLAVERALRGVSDRAAIVAVDAADGGILGLASRPTIGYHRALAGRYPPGGGAWPVVLLAAVEAGIDGDTVVACPDTAVVGGARFDNPDGLGRGELPLRDAVAAECRATIAGLARDVDDAALLEWAGALGFDTTPQLPLEVGSAQWPPTVDLAERAAASVGQGRVLATPLHVAAAAAAIESGRWNAPWLMEDDHRPHEALVLRPATVAELRDVMTATAAASGLPDGSGALIGESIGPDGELAWVLVTVDGIGAAVLVEDGRTGDAVRLAERFALEVAAVRD